MTRHALALGLLVLCGCPPAPPPAKGPTAAGAPPALVWARSDDSDTLDPAEVEWGEDAKITQNLFEPLVTFKENSIELEGRLARSWSFSADGKTVTFELRDGVKFHDGTPFNADAVVLSFERLIRKDPPHKPREVPYSASFADIEAVKADGPLRAVFTLKRPSAILLHNLTLFGANIVSPAALAKHGDKFRRNPVGTGPYRLARWEKDVKIELERFEGYWGPKPPVGRVIVVPVTSPQTAAEKLRKGEVHVVDHLSLADLKALESGLTTHVDTETSMNVVYVGFNMDLAPYNNVHFRRAVALALDRKELNTLAFYGLGVPAVNLVPPSIWKDTCPTPPYEEDLARAKEELAKAGLASNDVALIHTTTSRPYLPEPQRAAEYVRDRLAKIGLKVDLKGYDRSAYNVKYKEKGHPMFISGWNADIADADNFFGPLLHGTSVMNGSFFKDPAFDEAVTAAQSELDPAKRSALLAKAYDRYRAELPTVPLMHVKQVIALSKQVAYDMHPIEYRFYGASFR